MNFAIEAIQFIKLSPKRQVVFENIQNQQDSHNSSIRSLCPTRWMVRIGTMQAIVTNYKTLQSAMEVLSHGTDDCSRQAGGITATYNGINFQWAQVVYFNL